MEKQSTNVIIGPVRFSYANVWKPRLNDDGKEKYGVAILIPKSDKASIKKVKQAIQNAIAAGQDKLKGKKNPKQPLRDGDTDREDAAYEGCFFFNANSDNKPGIVDSDREPILDQRQFYSGCYGYVSVNFYAYPSGKGPCGIAAGLNNIMKTKEGEPLSGHGVSAEKDFEDIEIETIDDIEEDYLDSDLY